MNKVNSLQSISVTFMRRFRAAAIHLVICLMAGGLLLALFWKVWYPAPLFTAVGGTEIFLMLLAIDVVLGPLLTFIVFKDDIRRLKFDLAVVGTIQVCAMVYGAYTLFEGRPAYIAALGKRFDVVSAAEVAPQELAAAGQSLPLWGPRWVGVKTADDKQERERVLFTALAGADYGHFPQHHVPLEAMHDELLHNAKPISALRNLNPTVDREITAWLTERGYSDSTAVFQGLKARTQEMAVILDAQSAKVIGIAPFKPWE